MTTTTTTCIRCGIDLTPSAHENTRDGFVWISYSWNPGEGKSIICRDGMLHTAAERLPSREVRFDGPTRVYTLAAKFFFDHVSRDCVHGEIISETKRSVKVRMDEKLYVELMSDAICWSDPSDFDSDMRNLCASARATVEALEKQGRP